MANNFVRAVTQTRAAFTCTLATLANGSARQTTEVANTSNYWPAAFISFRIQSGGSAPTADTTYDIYLCRTGGDGTTTIRDDNAGASDAAITIENSPILGSIRVTATINKNFYGIFDTWPLGPLGDGLIAAVKNNSGQSLNGTEGNHIKGYQFYAPRID